MLYGFSKDSVLGKPGLNNPLSHDISTESYQQSILQVENNEYMNNGRIKATPRPVKFELEIQVKLYSAKHLLYFNFCLHVS